MILYIENPKESTKELLELINKFNVLRYTIYILKLWLNFYDLTLNNSKMKLKIRHFT